MEKMHYLAAAALILGGCRMNDALDSTISMNSKMDQTNQGMSQMNQKMDDTNAGMAQTNSGMAKTNLSIHKQTLLIALSELQKEENTVSLMPPTGMMPAGETFSNEATPTEMIQVFYLWLKEIDSAQADDPNTNLDRKKTIKLTGLEVIAGLAPQEKIDQLISEQVASSGRFESTVYQFLMLRSAFIDDVLIQESLLSNTMSNPGMFEEALKYMKELEIISKLKFRDKIAIKTIGMSTPGNNIDLKLEAGSVKARYTQLKDKLSQLDQVYSNSTDTLVKNRVEKIKAEIDRGIAEN